MATTPNYGLALQTDADLQDVSVLDSNFSIIDTAIKAVDTAAHKGAWTTFVPALTAASVNPTLGTSPTQTGRYNQRDKDVFGGADIVFGSGSPTAGTGAYSVSLPVAAFGIAVGVVIGNGYIVDVSGSVLKLVVLKIATTTTANLFVDGTTSPVGAAAPWVWATTDQIHYEFLYEAA